jgi:putative endonuclease
MYFILYSPSSNFYYVGYSNDPHRRLIEHNNKPFNSFTSKHRPWFLKTIFQCETESDAMSLEKFIKKQKSRKFIEKLCDPAVILTGRLSKLVRVPHMRD